MIIAPCLALCEQLWPFYGPVYPFYDLARRFRFLYGLCKVFDDLFNLYDLSWQDFDLIGLVMSFLSVIDPNSFGLVSFQITFFAKSVLGLASRLSDSISKLPEKHKIKVEWTEFFTASLYPIPLGLFVELAKSDFDESLIHAFGKLQYFYRRHANRLRSFYSIFHFLAVVLFKKSVYLANLLAGRSAYFCGS